MGRPIKHKYFLKGGVNPSALSGSGVTVSINNTGTHYSKGATAVFSAPDVTEGVQATLSLTIANSGGITAATIGNPGAGYTSAPTVTIKKPATVNIGTGTNSGVSGTNTFTVATTAGISIGMLIAGAATGSAGYVTAINGNVISTTVANNDNWTNATNLTFSDNGSGATFTVGTTPAELDTGNIKITAYLTTGSSAVSSEIIAQRSARRYLVENAQGTGIVHLSANKTLTPGYAQMQATDFNGSTYYVQKLNGRKAYLVNRTGTSTALVSCPAGSFGVAPWTTSAVITGTQVTIGTY